ncbi:MAG: hypothetical protein QNJ98_03635 [Planctomycetota bacterium]|nr:hypothetical protein [Planctomycetota bacterium]
MTFATLTRPRVLLVGPGTSWRGAMRRALEGELGLAESDSCEEGLAWLEGHEPGVTLLHREACGNELAEAIVRIGELFPTELVVVVAPEVDILLCRVAMRAGAFDVVREDACEQGELTSLLEIAQERLHTRRHDLRMHMDRLRDAVRRHEREAAGSLVDTHASSGAWADLEVKVRKRWLAEYVKATTGSDVAARARFVKELAAEIAGYERPGELLVALHVQAMASGHGLTEMGMEGARSLLVDLLARAIDERKAAKGSGSSRAPSRPKAGAWHRWRLDGEESWWLVLDGVVRAVVRVGSSAVEGYWIPQLVLGERARVVRDHLPRLPEALREVERRLGCGFVFDVTSAEG